MTRDGAMRSAGTEKDTQRHIPSRTAAGALSRHSERERERERDLRELSLASDEPLKSGGRGHRSVSFQQMDGGRQRSLRFQRVGQAES